MSRVRIRIEPRGLVIEVPRAAHLADPLAAEGVELPCGGRGECGGCRVRVVEGELEATQEDLDLLGPERAAAGWRLACRCRADVDATIEVEQWRHGTPSWRTRRRSPSPPARASESRWTWARRRWLRNSSISRAAPSSASRRPSTRRRATARTS